jgi:hypothetical protein
MQDFMSFSQHSAYSQVYKDGSELSAGYNLNKKPSFVNLEEKSMSRTGVYSNHLSNPAKDRRQAHINVIDHVEKL